MLPDFVAAKKNVSRSTAEKMLHDFCAQLEERRELSIQSAGKFFINAEGAIFFEPAEVRPAFLQPVEADRVIHPEAEHTLLVGDTETTNTAMIDYYTDDPVKKNRWWIVALVIGLIAAMAIVAYFSGGGKLV